MSKKFTSFLVVLAALLLTVPTQAQFAKKAAKQTTVLKAGPLKVNDVQKVKAAMAKANDKTVGLAFTGAMHQQVAAEATLLKAAINNIESDKVAFEKQMEANLRASLYGNQCQIGKVFGNVMLNQTRQNVFELANNHQNVLHRAAGEVVDENGVITAIPEGETKIYQRTGTGWYRSGSSLYYTEQAGNIEITETEDGTVYFKDFFSQVAAGTYIKGTKSGNTITVPAGQIVYYLASAGYGMRTGFAEYTTNGFVETKAGDPYILTIDGNTISLTETSFDFNTATGTIAALLYTDDNTFCGYGDNSSVFTYDPDWVAPELVELPEGATVETWYSTATAVKSSGNATVEGSAKVAFVGDDVYLSGIFSNYPDSWIKGTIDGTTVTFSGLQFLGTYSSFDIYAVGSNGYNSSAELQDFKMTYDATSKKFTSVNSLLANAKKDAVYFLEAYEGISITKDAPAEEVATTGANVDVLPYSNALNTADLFADFGVIDSNKDGSTWTFDASYGAYYLWNSANNGDDWLISPAIKLEAGKKYHFAIDAKVAGANFPERFEVLLGTEAKASALTQSVIAATEVTAIEYVTYENAAVEVAETGYYHFGIHAISDPDQFRLMVANFLVEAGVEATAPAAVSDFTAEQVADELKVNVGFKAPTKTLGGEDLTDLTKIDVLRNGEVVKSFGAAGAAAWDASAQGYENTEEVSAIDFGDGTTATLSKADGSNAPKYYTSGTSVRMYAGNTLTVASDKIIKKIVFTFDTAKNPAFDVDPGTFDADSYTWTGAANSILFTVPNTSGQQTRIQTMTIEYEASAGLTPGAEYNFVDEVPAMGTYSYQVIPYNASGAGQKSDVIDVFVTITQQLPYIVDFSNEGVIDFFQVIDANNDGKTWAWSKSYNAYNKYNSDKDADDYLISLPIALEAGKKYDVIVNANAAMEDYPERFEVKVGKEATVEGLTITAIEATDVTSEEGTDFKGTFTATEAGNYYVAIHAISDKDNYYLCVNKLTVDVAPLGTSPAAVTDLAVAAGAQGALEANVTFTAPSKTLDGDALTENMSKIEIIRNDVVVYTIEDVVPGSAQAWKDENVENTKTYTYQVVGYNASGKGLISEKVSVYVGTDIPVIENVTATDNGTSVTLSWTKAATVGPNGGYVDPAKVNYEVWSLKIVETMFGQSLDYDELLTTVTDGDSYDVTLNTDEGEPDYKYWAVKPVNETGEGDPVVASLLVGAPYDLPYADSFTNGTDKIYESDGSLYLSEESSDEDGSSLMLTAEEKAGVFTVNTGKINIKNAANPTLIFHVKGVGVNKMNVVASVDGGEFQTLAADVDVTDEFAVVKVPLASIKNARYVKLGFQAAIQNLTVIEIDWNTYQYIYDFGDQLLIDELRVVDLYEYNLVADIQAPKSVVAGQKAKVVATVTNEGENAAKDYTVTVKAGEEVLTTVLGSEELAPFAKDEIEVDFETSVFDEAGDVNLTVTVDFENELNPDDNTASTMITVKEPAVTAPASLIAEDKGADGVDLTWAMPETASARAAAEPVTESFETEGDMGGFTTIDADGDGYNWGQHINTGEQNFATQTGDGSVFSASYVNNVGALTPDNWLITPAATLDGTFSFYACGQDASYAAEVFAVYVSTTVADDPSAFEKVSEDFVATGEMTEYTVDLSAYAGKTGYIAIRHYNVTDMFYLVVDDVTYIPSNDAPVPTAFNIYVEKTKVADVEGDKTTYTVAADKLTAGEHTFAVTAVYASGAESKPVTTTITVTTIRQIAADGKAVDVYSVDGKLVRSQATSLDGLKGLYIVNGKAVMVK